MLRIRSFACVACALFALLAAPPARADDGRANALDAPFVTTRAASHEGRVEGDRIVWRTTLVDNEVPPESAPRVLRVRLAKPLPERSEIVLPPGNERAIYDAASATLTFSPPPGWSRAITIETVQPRAHGTEGPDLLAPPVVAGIAPQVILLGGAEGRRFEPDGAHRLVRHIGYLAPDDVDEGARRECAELTGARGLPLDAEPIYLRGTSSIVGDLTGRITTAEDRNRPGVIVACVVFLACGCLLVLGYRKLTSSAEVERADAELRASYEDPRPDARGASR